MGIIKYCHSPPSPRGFAKQRDALSVAFSCRRISLSCSRPSLLPLILPAFPGWRKDRPLNANMLSNALRGFCRALSENTQEIGKQVETEFRIFNTMSRQKELFKSKVPGKVGMYVCGVTTYDYSHIGHARVYVTFDILFRYLRHLGFEVKYVRNFTDIDDKIIARANDLGEEPIKLSSRFCKEFHIDMAQLQCLPPSVEPRVTNHISQIIEMIQKTTFGLTPLKERHYLCHQCHFGLALASTTLTWEGFDPGSYLANSNSIIEYGRLSGRNLDDNRAGERVAVDSRKQNPADFALWKSAKPGEPFWESPWGPGRPGWHIECSAMSAAHLGYSFDIHGGGVDLIFPHHENEIAQSCAACKETDIRYWMHNGFVTIDAEKMSKSLGNFFTIREVLESYHPFALRLFLMGTHYRSSLNYSKTQLESASDRIFYIYQTLKDCEEYLSRRGCESISEPVPNHIQDCIDRLRAAFASSMADDLHTPVALATLSEPLKIMNDLMYTRQGRKQKLRMESLEALREEIRVILNILGLMSSSYSEVLEQLKTKALKRAGLTEDELLQIIQERANARAAKDYAESDKIRRRLALLGIALMDGTDVTTWRPTIPLDQEEHVAS